MGVPPVIIDFPVIFHRSHPFGGYPIYGNPQNNLCFLMQMSNPWGVPPVLIHVILMFPARHSP